MREGRKKEAREREKERERGREMKSEGERERERKKERGGREGLSPALNCTWRPAGRSLFSAIDLPAYHYSKHTH